MDPIAKIRSLCEDWEFYRTCDPDVARDLKRAVIVEMEFALEKLRQEAK